MLISYSTVNAQQVMFSKQANDKFTMAQTVKKSQDGSQNRQTNKQNSTYYHIRLQKHLVYM